MVEKIFVSREHELAQLDAYLDEVIDGQGKVCFVKGQAGSGKTALVTEFASRAQKQHQELAVAFGQSDSQTGLGDPHLPFREILRQLTGDVEEVSTRGTITKENANRLQKILLISGQALVEVGPDLIGLFIPGVGLATRLGAFAAEKVGWLDKLERLVRKSSEDTSPGDLGIKQIHLYEQYANVLRKLSEVQPLILILDDLQWADASSIGLLFHLGRRTEGHRIFIVGTYRPEEVTIGRLGDRHPLEKVLTEFKRYFGDIWVDLDRAIEVEGERFVSAFLDTESNTLSTTFHQKLYEHTDGHPLFTIELLRNMQERGDLVQDTEGRWVETIHLNWESLPERVEGVIEERISRLGDELRQILTIGCVEGEDFTAEVVARVQAAETRGLIQRLSDELGRQHRLVRARGIRKLDPTGQRLSLYRFQHNLFQWYLYNELDEAERAYLHEDVGKSLEALYGDLVDEIVVQLARHYEEAGLSDEARHYLAQAGKQAADRFANDEAIGYFNRALDLTPENEIERRFELLLAREQVYNLQGQRENQANDLSALQQLSENLHDDNKKAKVALRRAAYFNIIDDCRTAITCGNEAVHLAEITGDIQSQAIGHIQIGNALWFQGEYENATKILERALTLSQAAGLRQVESHCLRNMATIRSLMGDYEPAIEFNMKSLQICREDGNRRGESKALNNLGVVFYEQGNYAKTREFFEQVIPICRETGERGVEGILLGNLGVITSRQGDYKTARDYYDQSRIISHMVGHKKGEAINLCNLGDVSASMGDYDGAKDYFEKGFLLAKEIDSKDVEIFSLNGLGSALTAKGNYSDAISRCTTSLKLAQDFGIQQDEAIAFGLIGVIFDLLGCYDDATEYLNSSLNITDDIGFQQGRCAGLGYIGLIHHHMGEYKAAQEYCHQSLEINQELDDPSSQATTLTVLGYSLVVSGMLTEAYECFQKVENLRRSLGQYHLAMEAEAGLARIYLIQENRIEAQVKVEEILDHLKTYSINGNLEPMRIYLTCYQVLKTTGDPRAEEILRTAYTLLQERASRIENQELQSSYLENVVVNREIVKVYSNLGDRSN